MKNPLAHTMCTIGIFVARTKDAKEHAKRLKTAARKLEAAAREIAKLANEAPLTKEQAEASPSGANRKPAHESAWVAGCNVPADRRRRIRRHAAQAQPVFNLGRSDNMFVGRFAEKGSDDEPDTIRRPMREARCRTGSRPESRRSPADAEGACWSNRPPHGDVRLRARPLSVVRAPNV
jgi:hypothetical protein